MDMEPSEETKNIEELYEETLNRVERGAVAKGRVISVRPDSVVVDVGYKSEGIISSSQFSPEEFAALKEGDEMDVYVERMNDHEGMLSLSKDRASRILTMEGLGKAFSNSSLVEGVVTGKTKGGLLVDFSGVQGFLPASQIDVRGTRDMDSYVGETLTFKVLKFAAQRQGYGSTQGASLIVSRRAVVEEQRSKKKEETLKYLKEDAILPGVVKNITDYGVFVDLGGIDGLLHISDISWRRVNHPSEFFSVGDEKEFIVLKYDESSGKITLGYKQKRPDPWLSVDEKYQAEMKLKGKVVNIVDYGIFVEMEEGLEGLIHVSELDWSVRPKHPSKYVSIGEEVEAVVINVHKEERRLSLSMKQTKAKPWDLVGERYKTGQKIIGKVKTVADFGAFVRLSEGVDGLIHISDISWTKHIKHPSEMLKKGQKIEAVVLSIEPAKERMALGIRQLTPDPWLDEIPVKFKLGEEMTGKVLKTTDFGVFVELDGGVEGLVYSSEMDPSREYLEGEDICVRIIKVNVDERKIGLSTRNLSANEG
jgi:small subunit ribosomal protein S1